MKKLLSYLKPYTLRVMVGMTVKFIGTVSELLIPWLLSYMIDDVVPVGSEKLIFLWGGVMVFCALACVAGNIVANRKSAAVARDVTRALRHDLYSKIAGLSCAQVDAATVPSLVSRLTTDTYNVHQMVGMVQRMGVRAPILLLGGILLTLTLDGTLALILIATMPLIGISVTMVSKRGIPLYRLVQKSIDELVRVVRENVSGARVIKALSKEPHEIARFHAKSEDVAQNEVHASVVMSLSHPFVTVFLNLGLVAVIVAGAYRVQASLTEPGKIVAFLSYFTIISNGMLGLTRIFVVISRASASANRIQEILDLPEAHLPEGGEREDSPYHIEFRGVRFSYNKRRDALYGLSFQLKKGQSLGIIGATGSGKSTILLLLMRFYDADEGEILINGRNVRDIPKDELHTMFGVTFQNDVVYSDTVRHNITLGREETDEEIGRAVVNAQAENIVKGIGGIDEHVNAHGTNLSGGQKQRLLIARALVDRPQILLLDDASSALDYRTDADLRRALKQQYSETTSVIVASRISSIAHSTQILVLDDGRVIGQGTHEELLQNCAEYRQIHKTQMGGMP